MFDDVVGGVIESGEVNLLIEMTVSTTVVGIASDASDDELRKAESAAVLVVELEVCEVAGVVG